jgi:type IV pilus assembly protein PilA
MKKQIPSPRRKSSFIAKAQAGFSLIELLVVIAVIGIIAAIAIPNIGNLTGGAETARNQRNAQTIASVSSSAMAAGWAPTVATGTAQVAILINPGVSGNIPGSTFKLDMDAADYADAQPYLNYTQAAGFSYVKDGTGTAN